MNTHISSCPRSNRPRLFGLALIVGFSICIMLVVSACDLFPEQTPHMPPPATPLSTVAALITEDGDISGFSTRVRALPTETDTPSPTATITPTITPGTPLPTATSTITLTPFATPTTFPTP